MIDRVRALLEADCPCKRIARTILDQMGGERRVKLMLGATGIGAVEPSDDTELGGVTFSWPNRQRSRGNRVEIMLMSDDTYRMRFFAGTRVVAEFDDVYADSLIDVFEQHTGWYLTLAPRR